MTDEFMQELKLCHEERINKEFWDSVNLDNRARLEYAKFCCWCRAFRDSKFTEQSFKDYQKQENIKLNFCIKQRIAELYFGYKFTFNYDTYKWEREKAN